MKTMSRMFLLTLGLAGFAAAATPVKAPPTKYTRLWSDSPFTSKPPPPPPGEEINPFEDLALSGVSPIIGGYRVTLMNKKKPDEPRVTVDSTNEKSEYKIVEVVRKAGNPLGTVVHLKSGNQTGTVSFDEKLLTIAAAPKPANPQAVPAAPMPGQVAGQTGTARMPRPRVVPPPGVPVPATIPQPQPQPQPQVKPSTTGNRFNHHSGR